MPMTLIQRQVLSGSQASVTFSNIPQNYQTLYIKTSTRLDQASTSMGMRFNNDSGTNYSYRRLYGNGSTVASGQATGQTTLYVCDSTGTDMTASTFSNIDILVPAYNLSLNKIVSAEGVTENNATLSYSPLSSTLWNSTAAISSITILMWSAGAGNFVSGSTFSLYGIS